jgi:hypothetical protein
MLRMEIDTQYYTGKPGYLTISGKLLFDRKDGEELSDEEREGRSDASPDDQIGSLNMIKSCEPLHDGMSKGSSNEDGTDVRIAKLRQKMDRLNGNWPQRTLTSIAYFTKPDSHQPWGKKRGLVDESINPICVKPSHNTTQQLPSENLPRNPSACKGGSIRIQEAEDGAGSDSDELSDEDSEEEDSNASIDI